MATRLRENGIDVVLDQWDLKYGHDLPHFMEASVRESDSVILVCTPEYARKADVGKGGAGYEKRIVTGEMFQNVDPSKFIPLVRRGSNEEALPSFLKSKNYIDFRNDSEFDEKLKDLLYQLHGVPKHPRPKLGPSPFRPQQGDSHRLIETQTISGLPPGLRPIPQRNDTKAVVYCQRCGVLPGGQSECTGLSASHRFTSGTGVIYCTCCGQGVGQRSECIKPLSSAHSFTSGDGSEYCGRCGLKVGRRNEGCTGIRTCHDFVQGVVSPNRETSRSREPSSTGSELDIDEKFELEGGEYHEILVDMNAGDRLIGLVEATGKISAYLLGESSLRSFDEGLGFNYYWGKEDPITRTKVSYEASDTRTFHFVVSNGYEEEDGENSDSVSVEVKLRVVETGVQVAVG